MDINVNIVTVFVTLFTIIDPFGLVPIYLSVTSGLNKQERRKTVFFSAFIAVLVLTFFLFFGRFLLNTLGLSFESFYIAGGILLFLVALDMLFGRPRRTRKDEEEEESSSDIAVFPLAIPMLAGPGTIATVIMFSSQAVNSLDYLVVFFSFLISLIVCVLAMLFSENILRIIKKSGLGVIDRLMGIILAAMAVQFVINAVRQLISSL